MSYAGGGRYMKTMTCMQLGGACDEKFRAETFEEMGKLSKKHAMEMMEKGDRGHIEKMEEMKGMMEKGTSQEWFEDKKKEFEMLSEDKEG